MVSGDGQRGGGVPVPGKGLPRAGGGMVHWRPAVQAFLKPGCVLPNVVQQPGKAAICFRAKGCGKSGGQICRSLQIYENIPKKVWLLGDAKMTSNIMFGIRDANSIARSL